MSILPFSLAGIAPRDKPFKLADGNGLFLLVQLNGSKLWRYRYQFAGVEKMMALGSFPATSLADARRKRDDARRLLEAGTDPSVKKKLDRLAAESASRHTFKLVAEEHVANLTANGASPVTAEKHRWLLLDVASSIAHRPVAEITSAELLDLLKRVEKSGRRETAKRLRATMSTVFRLAIVTLRATNDPTVALKGALLRPNVQHRAAITDENHFGALLRALDEFDGWPTISAAMKFMALTCARPGEVRYARRTEINFEKAMWRIPAERTKMRWDGSYLTLSSEKTLEALAVDAHVTRLSGAAVRMPSVNAEGAPIIDLAEAKRIKDVVFTHYGHGGPLFVAEMFRRGYHKEPGELQRMVKEHTEKLVQVAHNVVAKAMSGTIYRVAGNFAVLHVVGRIAVESEIIGGTIADIDRIIDWSWQNFLASPDANALDTAGDGADRLLLWLKSNPGKVRHVGDTTGHQQVVAWYLGDTVYLPVGNVVHLNLPTGEETVINELDKRGLLIKQGKNRRHARIPGAGSVKHYRIAFTVTESTADVRAAAVEDGADPGAVNFMFH